jgi:hypothetical protein
MTQINKIQDGTVVFTSTNPAVVDLGFNVVGNASVTKSLLVSSANTADGTIATSTGTDLLLTNSPGAPANVILRPAIGGNILLNNVAWLGANVTPGVGGFVGASSNNVLNYYAFVAGNEVSDSLSISYLNTTYPAITPGQMVVGSTVVYLNVGASTWRVLGLGTGSGTGGTPGGASGNIQYNTSGTFDGNSSFTWNALTTTLKLGAGTLAGTLAGNTTKDLTITGGTNLVLGSVAGAISALNPTYFTASTTSGTSIRVPHGVAPSTPVNGDVWTTTAGLFAYVNGAIVGPLAAGGSVTSVSVAGGTTGLTTAGGPITTAGTITLAGTLSLTNGGTGQVTAAAAINALVPAQSGNTGKFLTTDGTSISWTTVSGSGTGTVTSVAISGGTTGFSTTGGPITTNGIITLAGTLTAANGGTGQTSLINAINALVPSQATNAGKILTTNGSIVSWIAAGAGSVTSVAFSGGTTGLSAAGGPITTSGTLTLTGTLAVANGGTGQTASGASGQFLKSRGAAGVPIWSTTTSAISLGTINAADPSNPYLPITVTVNGVPGVVNLLLTQMTDAAGTVLGYLIHA